MITHQQLLEQLDYNPETGQFTRKVNTGGRAVAGDLAGTLGLDGYVYLMVLTERYKAHRLAWFYVHGTWPPDQIDHINRIKNDNRISNLRLSTQALNNRNTSKRKDNKSGSIGVGWEPRSLSWRARISVNGRQIYLGNYTSKELAQAARRRAEEEYGFSNE